MLLDYMDGHGYLLGAHDGKIYCGDLCYEQEKIRWTEYSIDDAVMAVVEWNEELLEAAQAQVECADNFKEYEKKKEYLDGLMGEEKLLDALFDRTRYGKELDQIAEKIAGEIISEIKEKGNIEESLGKLVAAVRGEEIASQEKERVR